MKGNSQMGADLGALPGHLNVGTRGRGVSAWVVADHDQSRGTDLECTLHDFPGIDGRVVHRTPLLALFRKDDILAIQKKQVKVLDGFMSQIDPTIIQYTIPRGERWLPYYLFLRCALHGRLHHLDGSRRGRAGFRNRFDLIGSRHEKRAKATKVRSEEHT